METQLLKSLLIKENYNATQQRIRRSIFNDDHGKIVDLIKEGHKEYDTDLTAEDIYALWLIDNPVATTSQVHEFRDIIDNISTAPDLTPEVANKVIENLWRQDVGRDIANLGINMSEGDTAAMTKLKALLEKVSESYMPDDFGEACEESIEELLAFVSDDNKWKFNIETLQRELVGLGPGNFAAVFARTEAGKTCFSISVCAAPKGFADQGAKVHYLCNEEDVKITRLRAVMSYAGMTEEEIIMHPQAAAAKYQDINERLKFRTINGWDVDMLDAFLTKHPCDVVVLDQIDKLEISGQFEGQHRKLGALYQSVRELAKRHTCAILAVTQASIEADGKTRLEASMMADSKTSKQAELDLIIGIGVAATYDENGADHRRFLSLSKNKLSAFHGLITCTIQPEISRYTV